MGWVGSSRKTRTLPSFGRVSMLLEECRKLRRRCSCVRDATRYELPSRGSDRELAGRRDGPDGITNLVTGERYVSLGSKKGTNALVVISRCVLARSREHPPEADMRV